MSDKKYLVIVESPAKAKTIEKYLGKDYTVLASMGHLRDLPKSTIGVDIENNFEPHYITSRERQDVITKLKKAAGAADKVFLATDPDREGEAISWHLCTLLKLDPDKTGRVTFNEITKKVVTDSIKKPRDIDIDLVNAQQARRVLDRIVGYQVSPILWKKIRRNLSAGRVQSAATRMVVDREKEIRAFVSKEYWLIKVSLSKEDNEKETILAQFYGKNGKKTELNSKEDVDVILEAVKKGDFLVTAVKTGEKQRKPAPPFITSSLQQEASRRLGMTPKRTMAIAQRLYEGVELAGVGSVGLITYMRTDSQRISEEALSAAGSYIRGEYGDNYYNGPHRYSAKSGAQDAHEAIRPTDIFLSPDKIKGQVPDEQHKLYSLIWKRFISSQMASAVYDTVSVEIDNSGYLFKSNYNKLKFPGFTKLYEEKRDDGISDPDSSRLPDIKEGEKLIAMNISPEQQFTQPPLRYTEASLIRAMEENGIGRPSTYAATMTTITSHNYVVKDGKYLVPTSLGEAVNGYLEDKFSDIVDLDFTNHMELLLDMVAEGKKDWHDAIGEFYGGFKGNLDAAQNDDSPRIKVPEDVSELTCEVCGRNLVYRSGKFGRFLACPGYPDCTFTMPLVEQMPGRCPNCGSDIFKRMSKNKHAFYICRRNKECGFITWDVPTADVCPDCGKTCFKSSGRGAKKSFCINPDCVSFLPEDKRGYRTRKKKDDEQEITTAGEVANTEETADKPAKAKKTAAAKKTTTKKETTSKKSTTSKKETAAKSTKTTKSATAKTTGTKTASKTKKEPKSTKKSTKE